MLLDFLFEKQPREPDCAPNRRILQYAIGLTGQNVTYSYISGWLSYFCINILHMDPSVVGRIFSASYVWDAVNDPIIGAFVDRRNHKPYNKLRPFLLYLPPFIGALSMLMFMRVPFNDTGKIVYILVLYFVWDFLYSFQDVSLWGLVSLSSPRSGERSRVAQWVSIGAGAGGALAGTFQLLRDSLAGGSNPIMSDAAVFTLFGILFGLGGELLSMSAHKMPEIVEGGEPEESVFKSLSILRHNPTILLISLARFLLSASPKVKASYFFENCVTFMSGKDAEFLFGLFGGVPGALGVFFANKIVKKIGGMKRLLLLSQATSILLRVIIYFVKFNTLPGFIVMTVLFSLINTPGSIMDIAHRSLTSDSIDEVELKTGVRSEGVCFSMQNFTTKMQNGLSSLIEGELLSLLKYDSRVKESGGKQNATFLKWQWPMFIFGPITGAVLYMIVISFVRDNKEHREEVERKLKERREALCVSGTPATDNSIS